MKAYPPLLLLFAIIIQIVLAYFVRVPFVLDRFWQWGGIVLIILGVMPAIIINFAFRRAETSIIPDATPNAFLTDGLFAYSRNPIYVGMCILLVGVGFLSGNLWTLCVPPIFLFVVYYFWVRLEETTLEAHFGDAYRDYCGRVRRWL